MSKVFCIGFNKTATTSLHNFFMKAGLSSRHDVRWPHASHLPDVQRRFAQTVCFSDGEQANFRELKNRFEGSVFILNKRPLVPWLRSRVKHVFRNGAPKDFVDKDQMSKMGMMAVEFFAHEEKCIDKWILERELYHTAVRGYFTDYDRYMEIDVTQPDASPKAITKMLKSSGFEVKAGTPTSFPKRNARSETEIDPDILKEYYAMIDKCIQRHQDTYGDLEL